MHNARIAGLSALCTLFACASCADDPRHTQPEPLVRPARVLVEDFVPTSDEELRARVDTLATRARLNELVGAEAARAWGDRLEAGIKYADLFATLYVERGHGLAFASRDGLTARGVAVVAQLETTADQGLHPPDYHLARIAQLQATLAAQGPIDSASFALRGEEAEAAVSWLQLHREEHADDAATRAALIDALLGVGTEAPPLVERTAQLARTRRASVRPRIDSVVELELRVADAAMRAARDIHLFNYKRLGWRELSERGGGKRVIYDRLEEAFADLVAADANAVPAIFDGFRPPHPQYAKLVAALVRYRAIHNAGGWQPVEPFDLARTTTGPEIDALRRRLHAETYLESLPVEATPIDDDLTRAIHAYQRTHQFAEGPPTPGFWRSINLPVERRIAQIELNLKRWRESFYGGEEDFIFVNIPDFHAEVYRRGERRLRFKVVVGDNTRVCDAQTRTWTYPNATPVQWSELDHLMLNPWWDVPERIFNEEIAPKLEDTAWLAEKGYEIYETSGVQRARQRPGPSNALGLVKFIFPNPHSTFMHDTPLKRYFEFPVRPFSHGCVRVHEPLELAAYLMTEYDHGGRDRMEKILQLGSTIKVEFEETIPVYFEYYTVRAGDDGHLHFLADPYHRDDATLGDDVDATCTPAVKGPATSPVATAVPPTEGAPDEVTPAEAASDVGP